MHSDLLSDFQKTFINVLIETKSSDFIDLVSRAVAQSEFRKMEMIDMSVTNAIKMTHEPGAHAMTWEMLEREPRLLLPKDSQTYLQVMSMGMGLLSYLDREGLILKIPATYCRYDFAKLSPEVDPIGLIASTALHSWQQIIIATPELVRFRKKGYRTQSDTTARRSHWISIGSFVVAVVAIGVSAIRDNEREVTIKNAGAFRDTILVKNVPTGLDYEWKPLIEYPELRNDTVYMDFKTGRRIMVDSNENIAR